MVNHTKLEICRAISDHMNRALDVQVENVAFISEAL